MPLDFFFPLVEMRKYWSFEFCSGPEAFAIYLANLCLSVNKKHCKWNCFLRKSFGGFLRELQKNIFYESSSQRRINID